MILATLTLATLSLPVSAPQLPPKVKTVRSGGAQFIDLSTELDAIGARAVIGQLGAFKDGKRKRLKDADAHLGTGTSVRRMSGIQFFRARTRTTVKVLSDPAKKKQRPETLKLAFEIQLARRPDGELERHSLSVDHSKLAKGTIGLFIVARDKKRKLQLTRAVPLPQGTTREKFTENMHDLIAVNRRLIELKAAVAEHRRRKTRGIPRDKLKEFVDFTLARKLELKNPENDTWKQQALTPWIQRLRPTK